MSPAGLGARVDDVSAVEAGGAIVDVGDAVVLRCDEVKVVGTAAGASEQEADTITTTANTAIRIRADEPRWPTRNFKNVLIATGLYSTSSKQPNFN
ncbi:MAG: hypothetical protein GY722_10340 [bacterium]|nr:hypothetical protein [bacterium]